MDHALRNLRDDHLSGRTGGRVSVCSSHPGVLRTVFARAKEDGGPVLVEATANQVNQFGGYTGMRPREFANFVNGLAEAAGLAPSRVVLGADHLGPHVWKDGPSRRALEKAAALARLCVETGFRKIHLDTGWGCADDPEPLLSPETAARRAASVCRAAEEAAARRGGECSPFYVIGAEVPPPGGSLGTGEEAPVTPVGTVSQTLDAYEAQFRRTGLQAAWERVVAVVVQPGVEFGDEAVAPYRREKARCLSDYHDRLPPGVTYEIHSTDYQTPGSLRGLVRDHFPLLKVGPCLTHAFREAVFALEHVEREWLTGRPGVGLSRLREVLESVMTEHPEHWRGRYRGTESDLRFLRSFSLRDRVRYYWPQPAVAAALQRLMRNLDRPIPPALLSQYFPDLVPEIQAGRLPPRPPDLVDRRIRAALDPYLAACR